MTLAAEGTVLVKFWLHLSADERLLRTDHPAAPWHVVAAEDERHARVDVVRLVCAAVEKALGLHAGPLPAVR